LKFLKSDATERRAIDQLVTRYALAYAEKRFKLSDGKNVTLQTSGDGDRRSILAALYGVDTAKQMLEILAQEEGMRLTGFISPTSLTRSNRKEITFFINGRWVHEVALTTALLQAYHTLLMVGRYPMSALFLEIPPEDVDVNVHPAKREVRFRDPNSVREAVVRCIRQTLESARVEWQEKFRAPVRPEQTTSVPVKTTPNLTLRSDVAAPESADRELPHLGPVAGIADPDLLRAPQVIGQAPRPSGDRFHAASDIPTPKSQDRDRKTDQQQFEILGVLSKLYVLMENANGLVLVDQHAAHERVLFEELRRRMEQQGVPTQKLLLPQTFEVPPRDTDWIEHNLSVLQRMGIGIESFGPNTFKIDSLPSFLDVSDPTQFMRKVIDDLKSAGNSTSAMRLGEEMIAKTVCRHAVKANDPLRYPEVEKLIRDLLGCDLPYCCPHGRPTMIQISLAELEKKFGRKV
jgi:DNA mismatch repair protein MutL